MPVEVRIPTVFRPVTDGVGKLQLDGNTVGEVLKSAFKLYPTLQTRLLTDDGKIRRFVNVYLGEEDIRALEGMDSNTPPGSILSIVPAVAGG
jgi:molybdopterin synthase sulfur carrier subunit